MMTLGTAESECDTVKPELPFPVYETISNPAVADSFQHQATCVF